MSNKARKTPDVTNVRLTRIVFRQLRDLQYSITSKYDLKLTYSMIIEEMLNYCTGQSPEDFKAHLIKKYGNQQKE